MRLAVVGYGTIVKLALTTLARELHSPLELLVIHAKPEGEARARELAASFEPSLAKQICVSCSHDALLAHRPSLAVEAAGHDALHVLGPMLLADGIDLLVTSVGALADANLREALDAATRKGGARYDTISGAIGGLDILAAAKLAGLHSVTYTGRKPPRAWKGTRAERLVDLDALATEHVFFEGDAGNAARDYPQNANVAATLALAGAGFERTSVRLVADPAISRNVHEISVRSVCADFTFRVEGNVAPDNPKTSMTTAYSLAASILQRMA